MSIIQIEITDDNDFNKGWLMYLLGMDRPEQHDDEPDTLTLAEDGWDMGKATPTIKPIREVFSRQPLMDHPQYVIKEVVARRDAKVKPVDNPLRRDNLDGTTGVEVTDLAR